MSHIDSFKHQLVGSFGYISVYRALQDIDGDFQCKAGCIILGGGSGEHPAMVLKDPVAAVARFIESEIDNLELSEEELKLWKISYREYLKWDSEEIIEFYEWGMSTYHDFYKLCVDGGLPNRYYQEDISIETWLIQGFGEFVFFSMPELAPEIINLLSDPYQKFKHVSYNNILLHPPNFPVYANGGSAFASKLKKIT